VRPSLVLAPLLAALLFAGSSAAVQQAATIGVYPSATTFRPSGAPTGTAAAAVALNMPIGGHDDAVVLVRNARQVRLDAPSLQSPLELKLFFAHYVSVGGARVPDALLPWNGEARSTEEPNQPLWLQVGVPYGTAPGTYSGQVRVVADGAQQTLPISVRVFPVTLPQPNEVDGSLLTAFHVAAESYGNKVASLFEASPQSAAQSLYAFLASYRISPNSWGYGAPQVRVGYTSDKRWWKDAQANMLAEADGRPFAAMAIPISNNRTAPHNYIAGLSPDQPQEWCSYLRAVHDFWDQHGWLDSFPYVYGMDEPGLSGFHTVAQQATVSHTCFPGSKVIVTGNPSLRNRFLWDGGSDDVDAWVVLSARFYGKYTVPKLSRAGKSNATEKLQLIDAARSHGAQIWAYTYPGTQTPGFTATEPLSDSRLFFLWAALEHVQGVLYGEGTTSYQTAVNPYDRLAASGGYVLVYPGASGPVPSARLEQIRNGIEDWEVLDIVRSKRGLGAVRALLGGAGLFSATAKGVELGCTVGCALKTSTPYSWPRWSQGSATPAQIEQARVRALTAAS
jgi:Domain of unknown function (DUF4091)